MSPPKNIFLKHLCSIEAIQRVPTQVDEVPKRQNCSETPCFDLKCFASYYLLECAVKTRDAKDEKNTENFSEPHKKRQKSPPKWHFKKHHKNPQKNRKQLRKIDVRKLQRTRFTLQKQWFQKAGVCKTPLRGPHINAWNPKKGAAN